MKSALLAAILLAAAAAFGSGTDERNEIGSVDVDSDDETDSAPFTVVLEHVDRWRCGGSLVSLRMVLTSARCARGHSLADERVGELWARAPSAVPNVARRVVRLAIASPQPSLPGNLRNAQPGLELELALAELEAAFGSSARVRPILVATTLRECSGPRACHVVRALPGRAPPRLRIEDAALAAPLACPAVTRGGSTADPRMLCITGVTLCATDWGAGLVCGGKLCGVVSGRLAGRAGAGWQPAGAGDECGEVTAAAAVARSRRFVHCAHSPLACKPGGECADLCMEVQMGEEPTTAADTAPHADADADADAYATVAAATPERAAAATSAPGRAPPASAPHTRTAPLAPVRSRTPYVAAFAGTVKQSIKTASPTATNYALWRGSTYTTSTAFAAAADAARAAPPASPRPAFEFEPNRADFKAGEYGDVAEYGGGEEPAGVGGGLAPTRTPEPLASRSPYAELSQARVSQAAAAAAVAAAEQQRQGQRAPSNRATPPPSMPAGAASVAVLLYLLCLSI